MDIKIDAEIISSLRAALVGSRWYVINNLCRVEESGTADYIKQRANEIRGDLSRIDAALSLVTENGGGEIVIAKPVCEECAGTGVIFYAVPAPGGFQHNSRPCLTCKPEKPEGCLSWLI